MLTLIRLLNFEHNLIANNPHNWIPPLTHY